MNAGAGCVLPTADLTGRRFACSWSGGKDAYLACQRAVAAGGVLATVITTLHEDGDRSRGHGLPLAVLRAQAEALGVDLVTRSTTWQAYEESFLDALDEVRAAGVEAAVFGDIDLEGHREWVQRVCAARDCECYLPLWQEPRRRLIDELIAAPVVALIVAVDARRLEPHFLGRRLDESVVAELEAAGVDVCGENGEYHTAVVDAPLFATPIDLNWHGYEVHDNHWVLRFDDSEGGRK